MKRALFALALVFFQAPAQADVLAAGEVLRVRFTIDNNWSGPAPDVLRLNFGLVQVLSPFTARNAALYDGANLLGIDTKTSFGSHVGALSLNPSNAWAAPGSIWQFKNPVSVDFATILDGSIDGLVEFTIDTGEIDIPLNQVNLSMILGTGVSSGTPTGPAPTLLSVEIVGDVGTSFCTALSNSTGVAAAIAASGSAGIASNSLVLSAQPMAAFEPAIFYYGPLEVQVPFGDGLRCVGGPVGSIERLYPFAQADASGVVSHAVDNTLPDHAPQLQQAGATWKFQAWFRDPAAGGAGFNLSDGLSVTFTP